MYSQILGKSIHYQVKGSGRPVIFVHGWGGSINSLDALTTLAAKEKFQAIILDLPGFGKSGKPDPNWGVAEYAQVIAELLAFLKIKQADYFGHSFGGSLGIYLAVNQPSLIDHLILCDSSYKRTQKKETSIIGRSFNNLPLPKKSKQLLKKIIYRIFFPESDLPNFPDLENNYKKIMTQDLTPLLEKIKQPTLILWGETDKQTPLNMGEELEKMIKKSQLKIFPGIGHNLPLKQPTAVFNDIKKFLC